MAVSDTGFPVATQAAALNVGSLFAFQARYGGARIALDDGVRQYTYAQANERVNRLAHALAAMGIQRGDRVGILAENRTGFIELELAAAKLAAIVAALNWRFVPAELDHCTQLVEPKVILMSARFKGQLDSCPCKMIATRVRASARKHAGCPAQNAVFRSARARVVRRLKS